MTLIRLIIDVGTPPLELVADVVRIETTRAEVVVAFRDVGREAIRQIERWIVALVTPTRHSSLPQVLVFHPSIEICAALERDLARLGAAAAIALTGLECMWHLQRIERCGSVVIAGEIEACERAALLHHLAEHDPQIRRVLLFAQYVERVDHASSARVDAVLRTPWHLRGLARAIGLDGLRADRTADLLSLVQPRS